MPTPEAVKQAILDLRAIDDLEIRVKQIVAAAKHALDDVEVVALAEAEITAACGNRAGITRKWGISKLHPVPRYEPTPSAQSSVAHDEALMDLPPGAWVDPNEIRIIRVLYGYGAALVLACARQNAREGDGSGKVSKKALIAELRSAGVKTSARTILDRWIKSFVGVLWGYDPAAKELYPYGARRAVRGGKVKGRLDVVKPALDAGRADLVDAGNLPGERLVFMPYGRTATKFGGNLLAAWHATRRDPSANIGRDVLCRLFGVSKPTLRVWEKAAGIKGEATYCQCADGDPHLTPDRARRAEPYLSKTTGEMHWRFRWSNRYRVPELPRREHRRAPRERRRAARLRLEAVNVSKPDTIVREVPAQFAAAVGQTRLTKINFFDKETSKRLVGAHQQIRAAIRKKGDDSHPYAAHIGRDRFGAHVVEFTRGEPTTHIDDRQPRRVSDPYFASRGGRGTVRLQATGDYA